MHVSSTNITINGSAVRSERDTNHIAQDSGDFGKIKAAKLNLHFST
jgi:hypothetical protein